MRFSKGAVKATCSSLCLHFRGGTAGVGVTTGKEKVYLVFYGSQWGTQGTDSKGYATFSGDTKSIAPDLQAFFSGLGNTGDKWSGVMTQYCEGVSSGTTKCTTSAAHVAYPTGGALAGVWEDTTGASPHQATGHQLAVEAEHGATHFGNTTTASNRDAQYVIISPTGANPDNYKGGGFCAWHDYNGDSSLTGGGAPGPLTAFTNLPYIPDAGANCGAGFVNPGNALDGVTIVEGHE
jgi:serine protease